MNAGSMAAVKAIKVDTSVPDSELSRDEIIARNLKVVEAHFHNETPELVENAVALYAEDISWEAPTRGVVMSSRDEILEAYRGIFRTVAYRKVVPLRRFATEKFVFDDQIGHITIVGNEMKNLPYPKGSELCVRLTHVFEMRDGKIVREIAYEMWREEGAANAVDFIPDGCETHVYAPEASAG
ncbi:nuclear transport factor 2 family protein [Trinickia terrae]|uniref:Nuclear transport factor 2 family protein n=1 Tax=Trinickia terrae TaxID=2571161 RepID=A0A4U1HBT6_9BURK|nr:nuclear transport factor 2 family protein [Trinickia terrae]TKC77268.1 nuclear transport factor 2 family protein [Trinickia terrae]